MFECVLAVAIFGVPVCLSVLALRGDGDLAAQPESRIAGSQE